MIRHQVEAVQRRVTATSTRRVEVRDGGTSIDEALQSTMHVMVLALAQCNV
jgi:hypothetical protein